MCAWKAKTGCGNDIVGCSVLLDAVLWQIDIFNSMKTAKVIFNLKMGAWNVNVGVGNDRVGCCVLLKAFP